MMLTYMNSAAAASTTAQTHFLLIVRSLVDTRTSGMGDAASGGHNYTVRVRKKILFIRFRS